MNPGVISSGPSVRHFSADSFESFEDAVQRGLAQAQSELGSVSGAWVEHQELVGAEGGPKAFHVDLKVAVVDFFD
jgi:flavin-binding protein dodecin